MGTDSIKARSAIFTAGWRLSVRIRIYRILEFSGFWCCALRACLSEDRIRGYAAE